MSGRRHRQHSRMPCWEFLPHGYGCAAAVRRRLLLAERWSFHVHHVPCWERVWRGHRHACGVFSRPLLPCRRRLHDAIPLPAWHIPECHRWNGSNRLPALLAWHVLRVARPRGATRLLWARPLLPPRFSCCASSSLGGWWAVFWRVRVLAGCDGSHSGYYCRRAVQQWYWLHVWARNVLRQRIDGRDRVPGRHVQPVARCQCVLDVPGWVELRARLRFSAAVPCAHVLPGWQLPGAAVPCRHVQRPAVQLLCGIRLSRVPARLLLQVRRHSGPVQCGVPVPARRWSARSTRLLWSPAGHVRADRDMPCWRVVRAGVPAADRVLEWLVPCVPGRPEQRRLRPLPHRLLVHAWRPHSRSLPGRLLLPDG